MPSSDVGLDKAPALDGCFSENVFYILPVPIT